MWDYFIEYIGFIEYSVTGLKRNTLSSLSRSCRFSAHILLASTQNVSFYSRHCICKKALFYFEYYVQ